MFYKLTNKNKSNFAIKNVTQEFKQTIDSICEKNDDKAIKRLLVSVEYKVQEKKNNKPKKGTEKLFSQSWANPLGKNDIPKKDHQ